MVDSPFIVFPGIGLLIGIFVFLAYKIYQDRQRIGIPVLRILLGAALCLLIWLIVVIPRPLHPWQRVITANCAQYGALLYYVALKRMFSNRRSYSFLRSPVFWTTTLAVLIIVILDVTYLINQPVFDSTTLYKFSWAFYIEAALSCSNLLFLDILIVSVYIGNLQRNSNMIDQGRLWLFLLAFLMSGLGLLLVDINLSLALAGNEQYRILLNSIYHVALVISVLMIVSGYTLPDLFFHKLFRPLASYKLYHQRQQQALLRQLHQVMVNIVPDVQLSCEQVHDLRVLIEISDARQVIWSQQERTEAITPQDEAQHLLYLLHKNIVLLTPGEHQPPPTHLKSVVKHNIITARYLRNLQKTIHVLSDEGSIGSSHVTQLPRKHSRMKFVLTSFGALCGITFLATAIFIWYLCNLLMYPARIAITHTPDIPYEEVQLHTIDHVTIRGWFIPARADSGKAPAILLLHGVADNRNVFNLDCHSPTDSARCPLHHAPYPQGKYPTIIDAFHQNGYALLAIDQRAEGESGGSFCTYGLQETRDAAAALVYLQQRPDVDMTRLGIYGSSMGAMTAIHAAAQIPAFRAIAVESPIANLQTNLKTITAPLVGLPGWTVEPLLKLYQIRTGVDLGLMRNIDDMAALGNRPFYAIADMKDTVTLPGDARKLYNASHASLRELWEVPDASHTESRFLHPDEFDQRLIAFFNEALHRLK